MPSPQPVILLPPSEGKAAGGDGPGWAPGTMADGALDRSRREVLRAARGRGRHARARARPCRPWSGTPACSTRSWPGRRCPPPPVGAATRRCAPCRGSGASSRPPTRSRRTGSRCPPRSTGSAASSTWWRPRLCSASLAELTDGSRRVGPAPDRARGRHRLGGRRAGPTGDRALPRRRGSHGQPLEQAPQGQPRPLAADRAARRPRGARRTSATRSATASTLRASSLDGRVATVVLRAAP